MTTPNSLPQSAEILSEVEAFIDSLPAKRRRRTKAEVETPSVALELNHDAQVKLHKLLQQLGRARSDVIAQLITMKIYALLGMALDCGKK
jgi:hypothetical protein